MSIANYSLPFGGVSVQNWATLSPIQNHATAVNNLLYGTDQETDEYTPNVGQQNHYYRNSPYLPPQPSRTSSPGNYRTRNVNNYLPPPPSVPSRDYNNEKSTYPSNSRHSSSNVNNNKNNINYRQQQQHSSRTYDDGSYTPHIVKPTQNLPAPTPQKTTQYYESFTSQQIPYGNHNINNNNNNNNNNNENIPDTNPNEHINDHGIDNVEQQPATGPGESVGDGTTVSQDNENDLFPSQPAGYTRVQAGQGTRTQVHAVLDYDEDEYYDEEEESGTSKNTDENQQVPIPTVTPIQGPIFLKNGTVPVVPLFSYPTLNNGSFLQIPIWWTALSVALGIEIRGEIIRGTPCIKRNNQLFCPTAGNSYPIDRIENFIDENKALMRRMYGDFEMNQEYGPPRQPTRKKKRNVKIDESFSMPPGVPDFMGPPGLVPDPQLHNATGDSYFEKWRNKRQSNPNVNQQRNKGTTRPSVGPNPSMEPNTGRVDACESKIEIVTPYWASNSAGKVRAIVNTQHFEQAIHQEVCSKMQTNRCGGDCGCEQKYKWHRLLAYDPDNDCKGIFMDWFLFPSCCVCRCNP